MQGVKRERKKAGLSPAWYSMIVDDPRTYKPETIANLVKVRETTLANPEMNAAYVMHHDYFA